MNENQGSQYVENVARPCDDPPSEQVTEAVVFFEKTVIDIREITAGSRQDDLSE
jgi:hypothetical protein